MKQIDNNKQIYFIKEYISNNLIQIILVIALISITIIEPSFISYDNLTNILTQSASRIIIALGVGGIIITRGIDISSGRIIGLVAVVSASLLQATDYAYRMYPNLQRLPVFVPILIAVLLSGTIGAINGFCVAKLKIPPIIATMGTMLIAHGMASLYFDRPSYGAYPIAGIDDSFVQMILGSIEIGNLKIPYMIIYALIVSIIMWLIWNKTIIGQAIFKIGKNNRKEDTQEIDIVRCLIIIYIIAGVLYGLAGCLEVARIGSVTNNTGNMYEIDSIVACIIGGVSFTGGIGSVGGIIRGVFILQILVYVFSFVGVSTYIQLIIKGIIIIAAVALDIKNNSKK